ncbi:aminotransferase class V-fold PLP-dependent enzyme [Labedella populi]|uniref:Kynureninase n=1 Tax=Labedella populi TaxID=2498850 RepID=A0A444QDV5_9MICO|nr:aminotransferase class V-fold PLP-dependent enzyme [Labedella populi]RWZ67718.1 aminotransferase class V-fold PLP-dependent enzyme [Labedella populi]
MTTPDAALDASLDAAPLDAADPLASFRDRFVQGGDTVSYLDGNSLGRPLRRTVERLPPFVQQEWGERLIRSWDETWMGLPFELGDAIGAATLGAAPGQTVVGDSTTVLLYKLMRAALTARPGRSRVVVDDDNFPTDRFLMEGIARELGLELDIIEVDRSIGVTPDQLSAVVSDETALVVLSHVAYRSGYLADMPGLTRLAHDAGALILWDVCHSAGAVPMQVDEWGVDIAVGCSYKYLNGGPGAPAFAYVRRGLQAELEQPIQGWMGAADVFAMADVYVPAEGMRRFLSGTPPVLAMQPITDMVDLVAEAGIEAIRTKSVALTEYALRLTDALLAPLGVTVSTPRDPELRGSHVTVSHARFREVTAALWRRGIIPDFRSPDGLRIGLSPLSTSFAEVRLGVDAIREELERETAV